MYLIKVEMSVRNPEVRYALGNCQRMHNLTTKLFDTDRKTSNILYRTKSNGASVCLYMYANQPVDASMHEKYKISQIDFSPRIEKLQEEQILNFDLVAIPSKKVAAEGKKHSQRRTLKMPEERMEWLQRKGRQNGFQVLQAIELEYVNLSGTHRKEQGGEMHHGGYHYQGILKITDIDVFKKAMQNGIGPGKAYGFGMILLK